MVYAIIKIVNGNYFIYAEGITDVNSAITQFHGLCQTLWNASDVYTGCVAIIDENLNVVYGINATRYQEFISHARPTPEPEPEEKPEEE